MKKKTIIIGFSALVLLALLPIAVHAAIGAPGDFAATDGISGVLTFLGKVITIVGTFISFRWIGQDVESKIAALHIMLWLLVFMAFFVGGNVAFKKIGEPGSAKKMSIMVAVIVATATTMLIPDGVLATLFATYATVGILIAFGVVIGLILYYVYGQLNSENVRSNFVLHLLRALALIFAWWILFRVTIYADEILGTTTFFILPLVALAPSLKKKDNDKRK